MTNGTQHDVPMQDARKYSLEWFLAHGAELRQENDARQLSEARHAASIRDTQEMLVVEGDGHWQEWASARREFLARGGAR